MNTKLVAVACLLASGLCAVACNKDNKAAADNTQMNQRDRQPEALTPMDQGGSETDRMITQKVRQSVIAQDAISTNAKNVKIITVDGVVTLRGPVASGDERAVIGRLAQATPDVKRVDNQIEVVSN